MPSESMCTTVHDVCPASQYALQYMMYMYVLPLQAMDSQLAELQGGFPPDHISSQHSSLSNHLPAPSVQAQPDYLSQHSAAAAAAAAVVVVGREGETEEVSYTQFSGDRSVVGVESGGVGEVSEVISEHSQSETLSQTHSQESGEDRPQRHEEEAAGESRSSSLTSSVSEQLTEEEEEEESDGERSVNGLERRGVSEEPEAREAEVGHSEEEAEGEEGEESYSESWPSDQGSLSPSEAAVETTPSSTKLSVKSEVVSEPLTSFSAASSHSSAPAYSLNQRVLVGGAEPGTVRFIGPTHFKPGLWIGVELDSEKGKNNGSIGDEQYFTCRPRHGVFAPVSKVAPLEEGGGAQEDEEKTEGGAREGETQSSPESSVPEEDMEEGWSESSTGDNLTPQPADLTPQPAGELTEPESLAPAPQQATHREEEEEKGVWSQGNEGETVETQVIPEPQETHQTTTEMSEVEGSTDLEPSSPAVPPPLTLPQEEVSTAPLLPAPPPDLATEAPEQPAESQTVGVHLPSSAERLASDLVQEMANEAFDTMHRIWRQKSPSPSPTSPTIKEHSVELRERRARHREKRAASTGLSRKADRITDELFALLLKSETELVCTIHSVKNSQVRSEPSSPLHRHSPSGLMTPPSLPTISETSFSPPASPPPSPPPFPLSPIDSPPGSPPRHLPAACAARVAAGDRSPPHRDTSPPPLSHSLSTISLSSLIDKEHFVSAQCMVPSHSDQIDSIVEKASVVWNEAKTTGRVPECPANILSLFSGTRELSQDEEHCQEAYIRLVYDRTIQVLQDMHPAEQPVLPVWVKHSAVSSQLVPKRKTETFDLEQVQKRVHAVMVRGQLPSLLPPVKFLHGMQRVGGKEIDFIDSVLIHELRKEEPGWVDYSQDEGTIKMRVADSLLSSLVAEAVQVMIDIERKRKLRHAHS